MTKKIFLMLLAIVATMSFFFLKAYHPQFSTEILSDPKYISCTSGGQLGNQMFHFASTLSYAFDHKLEATFPVLNETHNQLSYNRDHIFFRLPVFNPPVELKPYSVASPNYEKLPEDLCNVELEGGLFSWKFFDHHKELIQNIYAPSDAVLDKIQSKYQDLLCKDNTVAVHVRTYSKQIHEEGLHFVGMGYFADTIGQFPEESTFVIFSDRIEWCKARFKKAFPDKQFVFIEGNDHIVDLFLMSLMKHQILSKSTFSWWAAYLNPNPDKIVFAPVKANSNLPIWLKSVGKTVLSYFGKYFWSNEDYYLPEWNIVYYALEDYPDDIYAYGGSSTSVEARDK